MAFSAEATTHRWKLVYYDVHKPSFPSEPRLGLCYILFWFHCMSLSLPTGSWKRTPIKGSLLLDVLISSFIPLILAVYDAVEKLGSLVVRIVLSPVEEACFAHFSNEIRTQVPDFLFSAFAFLRFELCPKINYCMGFWSHFLSQCLIPISLFASVNLFFLGVMSWFALWTRVVEDFWVESASANNFQGSSKILSTKFSNMVHAMVTLGAVVCCFGVPFSPLAVTVYGGSLLADNGGER